jgi:hypothetical protein
MAQNVDWYCAQSDGADEFVTVQGARSDVKLFACAILHARVREHAAITGTGVPRRFNPGIPPPGSPTPSLGVFPIASGALWRAPDIRLASRRAGKINAQAARAESASPF